MPKNPWYPWGKRGQFRSFVEGTIVPKTFLRDIGHVIVSFSQLDTQLDLTIAHLLFNGDRALGRAIASAIPNYRPRIELFERLIDIKVTNREDQIKLHHLARSILSEADFRHRLVHDYMASFSIVTERLGLYRKEVMFRPKAEPTDVTLDSLRLHASQMTDLAFRLQRFTKNDPLWKSGARFPWRDKLRRRPRSQNRRPRGGQGPAKS